MKTVAVTLLLIAVVLLPSVATSTTVQVTGGFVSTNSLLTGDYAYRLETNSFVVFATVCSGCGGGLFTGLEAFSRGGTFVAVLVTPGGASGQPFGGLTFFNSQLPPVDPNTIDAPQVVTTPFTMTGVANIGATGFDLVGEGFVIGTFCRCLGSPLETVQYQFAVPEPTSLLLLGLALVAVCWSALVLSDSPHCRRRGHRPPTPQAVG